MQIPIKYQPRYLSLSFPQSQTKSVQQLFWLIYIILKACCKYNNRIPQSGPWLIGSRWHTVYIYCFIIYFGHFLHFQIQPVVFGGEVLGHFCLFISNYLDQALQKESNWHDCVWPWLCVAKVSDSRLIQSMGLTSALFQWVGPICFHCAMLCDPSLILGWSLSDKSGDDLWPGQSKLIRPETIAMTLGQSEPGITGNWPIIQVKPNLIRACVKWCKCGWLGAGQGRGRRDRGQVRPGQSPGSPSPSSVVSQESRGADVSGELLSYV